MALNVGPLTTIFTPPSSCLSVVTSAASPFSTSYSLFVAHFGAYETPAVECYPGSAAAIDFFVNNYYWSPGFCPQGYTTACAYTAASLGASATASLCCPSGFYCAYPEWPHVCSSIATTPLTNVWVLTGTTGTLPATYSFLTVQPSPTLTIWNDGVPVAWEETDTEILALIASSSISPADVSPPTLTPKASASGSSSALTPTPISSPLSSSTSTSSSVVQSTQSSTLGPESLSSTSSSVVESTQSSNLGPESLSSTSHTVIITSNSLLSESPLTTNSTIETSTTTSPPKNFTGLSPTGSATSLTDHGWFTGPRGTVRIVLIVVIPVVFLLALVAIFCCMRKYKLSINKRSATAYSAAAEADSRMRYEIASGQPANMVFRSELESALPFELRPEAKNVVPVKVHSTSTNTPELDTKCQSYAIQRPPSYPKSPPSPTIPRKPIGSRMSKNDADY